MGMKGEEIREIIQDRDLSETDGFKVEGPLGHKHLEGLEVPIFIFQKGTGAKLIIGKAVAKIKGGLTFEIHLKEEYRDLDRKHFSFDVPMRFTAIRNDE